MNGSYFPVPEVSLLDVLAGRARETPEKCAFELEGFRYTWGWLWDSLNGFAGRLQVLGLAPGERVLVALPTSADFFPVFYGTQRAGGIPVPVHPDSGDDRLLSLAERVGALRVAISSTRLKLQSSLECIDPAGRAYPLGPFPEIRPDTTAYIQFTSGSTGEPKGIPMKHGSLVTNIRQMARGMAITERDVFVSWLPVYHDMGLILMTMAPFMLGARLVMLPTSFVNLRRWLRTIQEAGGTFTAAPDFGYRLALRYAAGSELPDLHTLRVALNAAEPVWPETIREFEGAFGLKNVMAAGYGLAEATVGVSMTAPGGGVPVDAQGFVSVGRPFPGIELAILGEKGGLAGVGEGGEILVRSPANTAGYFGEAESPDLFWGEGYIRTGDRGYLNEGGELFILGRLKEMLKHAGQTVAPREVEAAVEGHPALRSAAAISADLGGAAGEQVVVFCELKRGGGLEEIDLHGLAVDLVGRVGEYMGFRPGRLYLVRRGSIPSTANDKVQRLLLRERFLSGELRRGGAILYPDF